MGLSNKQKWYMTASVAFAKREAVVEEQKTFVEKTWTPL
jgi:hypothetical protein